MGSKFEQRRLKMLLAPQKPGTKYISMQHPKDCGHQFESNHQKGIRKGVLFEDYNYLQMEIRRGNRLQKRPFVCFRDELCFSEPPLTKQIEYDNDLESDDQQVRQSKKRMVGYLKQQIYNNRISDPNE